MSDSTQLSWPVGDVVTPAELAAWRDAGRPVRLLDVRSHDEMALGTLPGAEPCPPESLALLAAGLTGPVAVVCTSGVRSARAVATLRALGVQQAASLQGGLAAWRSLQLPVVTADVGLTDDQRERYARHLTLTEVGVQGQRKLLQAKVILIGCGGLGSPAALYLAAAGVGTLGLVDDDVVELSNLQRQILHPTGNLGRRKVDSAAAALAALNPDVTLHLHPVRVAADNVLTLLANYDVVLDGSDSVATRYLLSDACAQLGKPLVHAAIHRFEGQLTVLKPGREGPCYRCLFPDPPPAGSLQSCADAGVLGVLPGVLGTLQATEVVKLILDQGELLVGRMLTYDAWTMRFATLRTRRDPHCAVCGSPTELPGVAST